MGRYSSVQAYSDSNPNMRAVSHEATASSSSSNQALKTEKVYNPYGSTAGAGSGEFHIYRHARAREKERLKAMDDQEQNEIEEKEYNKKLDSWKKEEEDRLNKKRKKRMRNKTSKLRKKNMNLSGVIREQEEGGNDNDGDEFEYTPLNELKKKEQGDEEKKIDCDENEATKETERGTDAEGNLKLTEKKQDTEEAEKAQPELPFKNDGSFLEMMKKMQSNNSIQVEKNK